MAGGTLTDTVDTSFGSDRNGLVWGYLFQPGRPAAPVTPDAAAHLLGAPTDDQLAGHPPRGFAIIVAVVAACTAAAAWLALRRPPRW